MRAEVEGMAYEAFRAIGMRVPGRVPAVGGGKMLWNAWAVRPEAVDTGGFFCPGCQSGL